MPKTEPPGLTTRLVAGELLRRRKAAGLSQGQVAEKFTAAGYPVKLAAYASIEAGKTRITVDMLTVAADVFGCSPTALLIPPSGESDMIAFQGPGATTAARALAWLRMEMPFLAVDEEDPPLATVLRWQADAFPSFEIPPAMRGRAT
ncbi:helix-turn-helix domain-containing protein [Gordonia sihwensis]|uniref:helix-turn-helix domain-containing protein n=1 Tax=Gordonia sihwensis TaxID=173559 RepID=UPI003D9608A8